MYLFLHTRMTRFQVKQRIYIYIYLREQTMKSRKVIKWMNSSSNFDSNRFIHRLYIELILLLYMSGLNEDERIDSI